MRATAPRQGRRLPVPLLKSRTLSARTDPGRSLVGSCTRHCLTTSGASCRSTSTDPVLRAQPTDRTAHVAGSNAIPTRTALRLQALRRQPQRVLRDPLRSLPCLTTHMAGLVTDRVDDYRAVKQATHDVSLDQEVCPARCTNVDARTHRSSSGVTEHVWG